MQDPLDLNPLLNELNDYEKLKLLERILKTIKTPILDDNDTDYKLTTFFYDPIKDDFRFICEEV